MSDSVMVKQEKKGAEIKRAHNVDLKETLYFDYDWMEYPHTPEGKAQFLADKQELTIDEQIDARNSDNQTKARTAAWTARLELAGFVKPNAENNELVRLKTVYNALIFAIDPETGEKLYTEDEARAQASLAVKVPWPAGK
jgi:hypothetical protein